MPTVIEENQQEESKVEKIEARKSNVLAESRTSLQVPKGQEEQKRRETLSNSAGGIG